MKNLSAILTLIVFSLALHSCSKHATDKGVPYYRFTEDDKTKLLTGYNEGDVLVYKNGDNEIMKFTVAASTNGKMGYRTGTFWGSYVDVHFYYDEQKITMLYAGGQLGSNFEITLHRYPVESNYLLQNPVIGTPAFVGYIDFPLWNKYSDSITLSNTVFIDFTAKTSTLTINNKTYSQVSVIQSGTNDVLEPNSPFPKNVNTLYYDQHAGVVGFDDVNGKMWRLQ